MRSRPWSTPVASDPLGPGEGQKVEFGKGQGKLSLAAWDLRKGMCPRSGLPYPLLEVSSVKAGQSWGEGKEEGEEEMFFFFNWKQ